MFWPVPKGIHFGTVFLAHNRHDKIETGQKKCAVAHCLTTGREFDSEDDVIIWMIDNQLARRNLSEFVKFELTATQKEALERIGLKVMQAMGAIGRDLQLNGGLSIVDKPPTSTELTLEKKLLKSQALALGQSIKLKLLKRPPRRSHAIGRTIPAPPRHWPHVATLRPAASLIHRNRSARHAAIFGRTDTQTARAPPFFEFVPRFDVKNAYK